MVRHPPYFRLALARVKISPISLYPRMAVAKRVISQKPMMPTGMITPTLPCAEATVKIRANLVRKYRRIHPRLTAISQAAT